MNVLAALELDRDPAITHWLAFKIDRLVMAPPIEHARAFYRGQETNGRRRRIAHRRSVCAPAIALVTL
jgi:hypothetical protein